MSKILLAGADVNRLLNRFLGDKCSFHQGELKYSAEGIKLHARSIDLKVAADIETVGLKINAKELKFDQDGADVDFSLG